MRIKRHTFDKYAFRQMHQNKCNKLHIKMLQFYGYSFMVISIILWNDAVKAFLFLRLQHKLSKNHLRRCKFANMERTNVFARKI